MGILARLLELLFGRGKEHDNANTATNQGSAEIRTEIDAPAKAHEQAAPLDESDNKTPHETRVEPEDAPLKPKESGETQPEAAEPEKTVMPAKRQSNKPTKQETPDGQRLKAVYTKAKTDLYARELVEVYRTARQAVEPAMALAEVKMPEMPCNEDKPHAAPAIESEAPATHTNEQSNANEACAHARDDQKESKREVAGSTRPARKEDTPEGKRLRLVYSKAKKALYADKLVTVYKEARQALGKETPDEYACIPPGEPSTWQSEPASAQEPSDRTEPLTDRAEATEAASVTTSKDTGRHLVNVYREAVAKHDVAIRKQELVDIYKNAEETARKDAAKRSLIDGQAEPEAHDTPETAVGAETPKIEEEPICEPETKTTEEATPNEPEKTEEPAPEEAAPAISDEKDFSPVAEPKQPELFPQDKATQENPPVSKEKPRVETKRESTYEQLSFTFDPSSLYSFKLSRTRKVTPVEDRGTLEDWGNDNYRPYPNITTRRMPKEDFTTRLMEYERRAANALEVLADDSEDNLIYQCFNEFSDELDDMADAFGELLAHYKDQRYSLVNIHDFLPHAFLVYVADLTRRLYDGRRLWITLFDEIGIADANIQTAFKKLFVSEVHKLGLPIYNPSDKNNYMLYTTLLHGGLTADFWQSLWKESFIPMARSLRMSRSAIPSGEAVLAKVRYGSYRPKDAVLRFLAKAPVKSLVPIFSAAINVAYEVRAGGKNGLRMIDSHGLSDTAMNALRTVLEETTSAKTGKADDVVCLDPATMVLDPTKGCVHIKWPKAELPARFADYRFDYLVNGTIVATANAEARVGRCVLPQKSLEVGPATHYSIELRVMEPGDAGTWKERGSLAQSFERSKPGCFEFVKDPQGTYKLRTRKDRIKKPRTIAYMVKRGREIVPECGMELLNRFSGEGMWGDTEIFEYLVQPGASATIEIAESGAKVSSWHEAFNARVDRTFAIGRTVQGLDLYGMLYDGNGANVALPSVIVELPEEWDADDSLLVAFRCDGETLKVPAHETEVNGDSETTSLCISFPESKTMPRMATQCELIAVDARTKAPVLRYQFAIAPIQSFHIVDGKVLLQESSGIYEFMACDDLVVENAHGDSDEIKFGEPYYLEEPLDQEFAWLRLRDLDENKTLEIELALACLEITASQALKDAESEGTICLATRAELGIGEGAVTITAKGSRRSRSIYVALGATPLAHKDLSKPTDVTVNIFEEQFLEAFLQQTAEPEQIPLSVTISYGHEAKGFSLEPAVATLSFLNCETGFGLGEYRFVRTKGGTYRMRFNGSARCDLHVDFVGQERSYKNAPFKHLAEAEMAAGESFVDVPQAALDLLYAKRNVQVTFAPMALFEVDYDSALTMPLRRGM